MAIKRGTHCGLIYYYDTNRHYGSHCEGCGRDSTLTSIHGSCLDCGYQKYPSRYRHSGKRFRKIQEVKEGANYEKEYAHKPS